MISAAHGAQCEVIKWLHENGCPWDYGIYHAAVSFSRGSDERLEIVKYAYHNGLPLDSNVCAYAAGNYHANIVKWIHDNVMPWNGHIITDNICGDVETYVDPIV